MSSELRIASGERVIHDGTEYLITRLVDFKQVIARKCGTQQHVTLPIQELKPLASLEEGQVSKSVKAMPTVPEHKWNKAVEKMKIIEPLLAHPKGQRPLELLQAAANEAGVCRATIHNWINRFEDSGVTSALLDEDRNGGRGEGRLGDEQEKLIESAIKEFHLKKRKSVKKTFEELEKLFQNAGLKVPHVNTLYRRVSWISAYDKIAATKGKELAEQLCSPKPGLIINADTLLAMVQIDHMYLDIQIVDDRDRLPIGRAWLTLAFDVFSRCVVGLYVSLDPPSAHSAGMCMVNAILPKNKWLYKLGIDVEWPCWGKMKTIQMDNAKEFRGKTIERACKEHLIDPLFRVCKKPRYGAYIERYLGTVAEELKSLPGATFSTPDERGCYDSEGHAALTFSELEAYLINFIVGDYHQRIHSELSIPPLAKWREGVFGTAQIPGRGLPPILVDENRLRLDFSPYTERTIQSDGIQWGHIHYYDDVLRRWYNHKNPKHPKHSLLFRFHYDPRDISVLYFYDPKEKRYFRVPYRDPSQPPMSKWERDTARLKLRADGAAEVNETAIFSTRKKLRAISENAVKETKHQRRERQRRDIHRASTKPKAENPPLPTSSSPAPSAYTNVEAFDDLDA